MTELNLNSPEVKAAIAEHNLTPGTNGKPAVKVGSRKKTPKVEEPVAASVTKKKLTIELTTAEEFRLLREASVRNIDAKDYLQEIVSEKLGKGVGSTFISAPRLNGEAAVKITAPTNNYGRDV